MLTLREYQIDFCVKMAMSQTCFMDGRADEVAYAKRLLKSIPADPRGEEQFFLRLVRDAWSDICSC